MNDQFMIDKPKNDPRKIAYEIFDMMQPRERVFISSLAPKRPDLFMSFAKDYIDAGGDIEFSNDYTSIRKLTPVPKEILNKWSTEGF